MIKPILIPTDKQSIEIGDLTLPNNPNRINGGELGVAVRSFVRNDAYKAFDIILVDTEAEITKSDWVYDKTSEELVYQVNSSPIPKEYPWYKIISSTDKSHRIGGGTGRREDGISIQLPQLSPQSIQLLINYYNEHRCMPESIEMHDILRCYKCGKLENDCINTSKNCLGHFESTGEVDITIPEVEEKLYTEGEVAELCYDAMKERDYTPYCVFQEWFNLNKK